MEIIFSLGQIREAAQKVTAIAAGYKVVALHGDMGVGKTTFVKALCEAMGVHENISSPTFSIINQYKTIQGNLIYHLDLYRLKDEQDAISSGVEDCLFSGNTCFVEWPEIAAGIFPDKTLHIFISLINAVSRKLITDTA